MLVSTTALGPGHAVHRRNSYFADGLLRGAHISVLISSFRPSTASTPCWFRTVNSPEGLPHCKRSQLTLDVI